MSEERRRSPRIEMLGRVQGHSVSLDQPITVLEMSLGGMSIETGFPLEIGSVHVFRLTLGDGATIEVTARVRVSGRVMHTRSTGDADKAAYVTGMQFVDDQDDGGDDVGDIIDRVRS